MRSGPEVVGWAGGDRRTTRARMALSALLGALKDAAADTELVVIAPRSDALTLHSLVKPPAEPITDDADLRKVLTAALAGRNVKLAAGDPAQPTPLQFAAAWADTAAEKAKMGGAFNIAIPRTNLAKVKGL
ncbi:MAG: hypothetical protein AB1942_19370 [Pseudomonadota bacterium]